MSGQVSTELDQTLLKTDSYVQESVGEEQTDHTSAFLEKYGSALLANHNGDLITAREAMVCKAFADLVAAGLGELAMASGATQQSEEKEQETEDAKDADSEDIDQEEPNQATPEPEITTPALKPSEPESKDVQETPQPQVMSDKASSSDSTIEKDDPSQVKEAPDENNYRGAETAQAGGAEVARLAIIEQRVSPENKVPEAKNADVAGEDNQEAQQLPHSEGMETVEEEQAQVMPESSPLSSFENIAEPAENEPGPMTPEESEEIIVTLRDDFESEETYSQKDDETYLTNSSETPVIALPEFSADGAQAEVAAPELSLSIEEVEEAIFLVAERIEVAVGEDAGEVQQLLEQILTEVEDAHSAIDSEEIHEEIYEIEETKEELEELFIKLFDLLNADYTPELIDSFVVLALKGDISKLMSDNEDEEKLAAQGMGTHEIINQLIAGLRSLKKLAVRAYLVGRSALQLYGYEQQPSAS